MRAEAWLVLAIVLAGCASPPGADAPAPPDDATPPTDALAPPSFLAPLRLGWGGTAAEPSVAIGPDGSIVVAAAPQLWRSVDGGASFEAIGERGCAGVDGTCLPGEMDFALAPLDGFGGDADVAFDPAGALHYVGLNGETGVLPYQRSEDLGDTWTEPVDLAEGNASDRQWVDVLPDGTLVVTWREPDVQLMVRRSLDGGLSWEPAQAIGPDALQGPLAHGPDGALYFAFYDGGIRVARSVDAGATWTFHDAALETRDLSMREGRPIDMFPIVAVDDAGAVYVTWATDAPGAPVSAKEPALSRVWLIASADGAASWSAPLALSPEDKVATFPWIVAGAPGSVALAWYQSRAGTPSDVLPDVWDVVLAQSADASAAAPTFVTGVANDEPVHVGAICRSGGGCDRECALDTCAPTRNCMLLMCVGRDRSRLEFFEIALTPDGFPVMPWVADAPPPAIGIEIHFGGVADGTAMRARQAST